MRRPVPPQRSYQTARERVAVRRGVTQRPPRRQRRGCLSLPVLVAAVLLVVSGLLVLGLGRWVTGALGGLEGDDPRRAQTAMAGDVLQLPADLRQPFNVLLIGVDRRDDPEDGVRSDTLILTHVNPVDGWAGMLAIPRDSMVTIPNLGVQKVNTAYTYGFNNASTLYGEGTRPEDGGGALAAETVEAFLNLSVDYIAQVDFQGFEYLVKTLGGVTIDVERPLLDPSYPTEDYGYERLFIPAGLQIMDGPTALKYARSRHSSSDFDRSARQQQVLRAFLAELRNRNLLAQAALLPELVRDLEASVTTTLPISDPATIRGLAAFAQGLDGGRIISLSINPSDVTVVAEDGSNIYWDPAGVATQVARLLAGPTGGGELARIQVLNGAGVRGLAGRVTARLTSQGFDLNQPTDAPSRSAQTMLIDYTGRPESLRRLAETLGLGPDQVYATPPASAPAPPFQTDIVLILGTDFVE
ncbi:LCP family protein [Candidatus Chloroploca asiatica]|uniref:LytR family transcriptional regulator n=1 Tax=Candidatus Chloroploca asiatica TaxID=1506545 RepID=A0A2H3L799_9CHLR|nr:LCP family protein [Candidatus Chloroploca asiatica]PDW00948.1 LytR family transcriptional regulator [Candidatus Chloroploca asiatica]